MINFKYKVYQIKLTKGGMNMEKLFEGEYRLMEVLWEHAPINSTQLVGLCKEKLDWNKSTTYTVLRKLKNKGAVRHEDATVSVVLTPEQAIREETRELERWAGGLTPFVAAFMGGRKLTMEEAEELKRLIDENMEEG